MTVADALAAASAERSFGGLFVCGLVVIIILAAIKAHYDNQNGRR